MTKIIRFESTSEKSTSTEKTPFSFPDSVQSDLFGYLKPAQRKAIRPFLQIIKRPYQEKLCISLMDYLEGNGLNPISQPILRFLQNQIIEECSLHPLTTPHSVRDTLIPASNTPHSALDAESHEIAEIAGQARDEGRDEERGVWHEVREPKSIGALIKQLFPSFANRSNI